MYNIVQLKEGGCLCRLTYQDGIEEWQSNNLQQAVQKMIRNAEALSHAEIKLSDIKITQESKRRS